MSKRDAASRAVPKVALAPGPGPGWLADAIADGGGELVALDNADALIWVDARDPRSLAETVARRPELEWVQLPFAGVENFIEHVDANRRWTCGKGVYADPVAELVLGFAIAGLRNLVGYCRTSTWSAPVGRNLVGARVSILGGGGIAESLIRLLRGFDCHITVVRSTVQHMDDVDVVIEADRYDEAIPGADVIVLALPLTAATAGMIGADELALMEPHAWLVNVARGGHVDTDALVRALTDGTIGGAALDVTDPEPLPDDHPLWALPNCVITPHIGNTPEMAKPLLAERVRANVRRFASGDPLLGSIDLEAGY